MPLPLLPTLTDLEAFLAEALLRTTTTTTDTTAPFLADDPQGIWRPGADPAARPVTRLGLALEPWPGLSEWTHRARLDALWLHRPWRLAELTSPPFAALPEAVGVLAHHLAFDERLTTGLNPRLANALSFAGTLEPEPFGEKDGRPVGMVGALADAAASWETFVGRAAAIFGGTDEVTLPTVIRSADGPLVVAVVGAMTDTLVRHAATRGVHVYVTGQWRRPAKEAVRATGMGVVAVGHARAERWGVRALADLLRERWAELDVRLAPTLGTHLEQQTSGVR